MKPRVLVLDEPTANLDPMSASSVMDVLVKINKESGVTVILVEHRLEMAAPHADRCVVFDGGKIVLDGPPAEVLYSEAMEGLGIGVPKVVQVAKRLISEGKLGCRPLSSKELAEKIKGCRL
jgi:energy-coupling factor transporter ATP-binding protein EcfA2